MKTFIIVLLLSVALLGCGTKYQKWKPAVYNGTETIICRGIYEITFSHYECTNDLSRFTRNRE